MSSSPWLLRPVSRGHAAGVISSLPTTREVNGYCRVSEGMRMVYFFTNAARQYSRYKMHKDI